MTEIAERVETRRMNPRFRYGGRAEVGPARVAGAILNLSCGGCLLRLDATAALEAGTVIDVGLQASHLGFRGLGQVKSLAEDGRVVGIEFALVGPKGRGELRKLMGFLETVTGGGLDRRKLELERAA
jgi:hypothetical protein